MGLRRWCCRAPDVLEPALLLRGDGQDLPDGGVLQVELGNLFQRLDQRQADMVHVAQLLRHGEQGAQHDPDRLAFAVPLIDHVVGQRIGAQPLGDMAEGGVAGVMDRPQHAAFQGGAGKSQGLGRAQHGSLGLPCPTGPLAGLGDKVS